MPVPCGSQTCQRNEKISYKLHKTNVLDIAWNYKIGNILNENFHELNWLPIKWMFHQCVASSVFKFVQNQCLAYMNEVFWPAENVRIDTRKSFLKLNHPFQKTSTRQKSLSYIGPAIWNRIPEIFKKTRNLNTFKQDETLSEWSL